MTTETKPVPDTERERLARLVSEARRLMCA